MEVSRFCAYMGIQVVLVGIPERGGGFPSSYDGRYRPGLSSVSSGQPCSDLVPAVHGLESVGQGLGGWICVN